MFKISSGTSNETPPYLKELSPVMKYTKYRFNYTYGSGVMVQLKVLLILGFLVRFRLAKGGRLAKMVVIQLRAERFVIGLGEHALLLKDGQDTHGL